MPLDPVIQALFQEWPNLAINPVWEKAPAEARADFKQFCRFADPRMVAIGKSEDIKMPGPAGAPGLRVYTPVAAGGAPLSRRFSLSHEGVCALGVGCVS